MTSTEVRNTFLDFFKSKQHYIVPSAPLVVKNDPTLMFTNAGMNQFKDYFLGNETPKHNRIADTQKCLRVSGKHNDLEEVGHDTYHHTMFEMLGNWSFGDYFKKEAIAWGWELLTSVYKINKDNLYVTVFAGDKDDNLPFDQEAYEYWKEWIPEERILKGSRKDNFWEMGDTGPCGPCSEIHVDLRSEEEKKKIPGKDMVNQGHPRVIEIWNLVFIEFNRLSDGRLVPLPAKHVDTGMGFERLCMVLQQVESNYDTDVFQPLIKEISQFSGIPYGQNEKTDIAMRVVADHLRAVAFAIADGQLPSNNKAGYVIRRILRRAVRYGFTFLHFKEPFICRLTPKLVETLGNVFPELQARQDLIFKVISEEEHSFLRTLETGIKLLDEQIALMHQHKSDKLDGKIAFELYDTYGFPFDLTCLILKEQGLFVDSEGFENYMLQQKERSRQAAEVKLDDWVVISEDETGQFIGYDTLETEVRITRFRKVKQKEKEIYQLVFDKTPFYAESGGQVGDSGELTNGHETFAIINTIKENNLTLHITEKIPSDLQSVYLARVNAASRYSTARHHSATHLLHYALRQVLGNHVEQKGSLVHPDYLRFDFSHFQKMSEEEIRKTEQVVNQMIRDNIVLAEHREMPMEEAQKLGAMSLFGEKYGEKVRVIGFGPSVELCGGTHVPSSGNIGMFKIVSESAIAAGIRRIEAIAGEKFEQWLYQQLDTLNLIKELSKNPANPVKGISQVIEQNEKLQKNLDELKKKQNLELANELINKSLNNNGLSIISCYLETDAQGAKDIVYAIKQKLTDFVALIGYENEGKAGLTLMLGEKTVSDRKLDARILIRELSKEIQGGGGGQDFFATAGGKNPQGLPVALNKLQQLIF